MPTGKIGKYMTVKQPSVKHIRGKGGNSAQSAVGKGARAVIPTKPKS